jgi:MOSC domain-containing protein YiiM
MKWTEAVTYDDRDLARTLGNLDGFFNCLHSDDGRGLTVTEPSAHIQLLVRGALENLSQSSVGSFSDMAQRLATCVSMAGWRDGAAPVLEAALAEWSTRAQDRRAARTASLDGQVQGLFRSGGGVPKLPVDRVDVGLRGIDGDRQAARQHHGRPWQALCLWSAETIGRLQLEGHPIAPGNAGENITVAGIDWTEAVAGAQLRIGEVVAELTIPALPCSKNAKWFVDGNFNRMHHAVEPGVTRMYASVVQGGTIAVGDRATLVLR